MSGAKPVMGQTQRDGCPVQRICSDLKRTTDPDKFRVDRKSAAHDSPYRKSIATSLKMLLANEMTDKVKPKRKPPSVVARLMGLEEDLPSNGPVLHHAKRDFRKSQSCNQLKATNKVLKQQEQHHSVTSMTQDIHPICQEAVGYNDAYDLSEEQSRKSYFQEKALQKGGSSGNTSDRMDILREKFRDTRCFGTGEKALHLKELQALRLLSSNKSLFLKLLEEPNSSFSRQLNRLHTNAASPQRKRIMVLKPLGSVECGVIQSGTGQTKEQNGVAMREFHRSFSLKEENPSQASRIVLLRPTPGKPSTTKAKLTPRSTPFLPVDHNDLRGPLNHNGARSTQVAHGIIQNQQDDCHRRDESLLSSSYSNGYGGDESSLGDSEIDQNSESDIDYDDGCSFTASGECSPKLKHPWHCTKRYENPYSESSFSKVSRFPESSVTKEAKQRLSERWATVSCDEISQEQVRLPRSTCTLGQMLSLHEVKNDDFITEAPSVSTSHSCDTENELPMQAKYVAACRKDEKNGEKHMKLPRSTSVPVIPSTFDNMVANVKVSDHGGHETTKDVLVSNKEKSSFRGRVSDFFFSRSKRTTRQISANRTSDWFSGKTEACGGDSQPDAYRDLDANEKSAIFEDTVDICAMQISTSTSEGTTALTDVSISLDCPNGNLNKVELNEVLNSTRDQPSPSSVLDAPSEDSSSNEPESSANATSKNASVSRSSAIEAVACSLSWDDTTSESPSLSTKELSSLVPDVDDDESECHVLVQNIMSSAGLDDARPNTVFAGWHLPDCPLDPVLFTRILELREQSSYHRLLFDCVNVALVEIGENTLLSTFPWSKAHSRTWRDASSPALGIEVWSILKDWIYGARMFVVNKRDNAGIIMDRIVKQEVEGRGWVKTIRTQLVDITEHIEAGVLEDLVGEAVLDFGSLSRTPCLCNQ
ncbi:hypothetical protein GUJ93_ZPchr0006g44038 [Zizania palustris]|uniref:DUF4378 domain-containing protein n=1 Tax=Zizania palustris TaxID=103762 RepID=A0A8J5SU25_ZIZPA|nr:hypothetical protein GUJ93_ZPchr0006g44038 [Zizania palustris]